MVRSACSSRFCSCSAACAPSSCASHPWTRRASRPEILSCHDLPSAAVSLFLEVNDCGRWELRRLRVEGLRYKPQTAFAPFQALLHEGSERRRALDGRSADLANVIALSEPGKLRRKPVGHEAASQKTTRRRGRRRQAKT